MVSCYSESETLLHIASLLGHLDFVQEILRRKPELAGELDSRKASPLHLAATKGYLDIILKLVSANPGMCSARDRDGRNPLHTAAIRGHVNVLRELVKVRPQAALVLMERGEPILHACVNYNQLESLKLLVETMNDHEFVNSKDDNGNTILHLAVVEKQVEAVKFFTVSASTAVEVNALNVNGLTALDILTQSKRSVKDWEIGESLRCAGAINAKWTHELGDARTTLVLKSDETCKGRLPKNGDHKKRKKWLEDMRSSYFDCCGGIPSCSVSSWWSMAGRFRRRQGALCYSILADVEPYRYSIFLLRYTIGFFASLSIILLLVSCLPFIKHRFFRWILMAIMWMAISAMAGAYLVVVYCLSDKKMQVNNYVFYVMITWVCLEGIHLLAHIIRLTKRIIKYLIGKMKKRRGPASSSGNDPADHTV